MSQCHQHSLETMYTSSEDDNLEIKFDTWLSLVFFPEKYEYLKKQNKLFYFFLYAPWSCINT